MKHPRQMCALVALFFFTGIAMFGQAVSGTVLGTITDSSGGTVGNAKVTLTEVKTSISRNNETNASGNYVFPNVPEGTYSVTVEYTGFKKAIQQNIDVNVNQSTRVDLTLEPGAISQSVEVTAAPPPLQTDRADLAVSISAVQTENLPVGTNRNFQGLLNLVPGTTRATFQHSQFFNAASSLQTQANGQMRQGNNYQIEGIDDNERTGLLQIIVPPIEAIQTVDVSTSNFDAELGRASGAVTNVILKSGTNQIHGAAYEFLQNSELNARNFFDPSVGHLVYNYFGGNVGGAVIKNKLFYFGDILRITDHKANTNTLTIPGPVQAGGDLSAAGSVAIYDPATGNPDGTLRTQFPLNKIPANRINPISSALLGLLPAPNNGAATSANNYFALLPFHKRTTSYDVKVDDNLTDKDRLAVRLSYTRPEVFQAPVFGLAGGAAQGAFQGTGVQRTYSGGINYTRVFSPSLVGEFRAGVAYYNNVAQQTDYGINQSAKLGIPGINIDALTSGLVGINIGAFYSNPLVGYSASLPWVRAEANIDVANTWTKIRGNHTIKWGGDYRQVRDALLQLQTFSPRGVYTFASGQTQLKQANGSASPANQYNNFAAFLLDLPNQAGRDFASYFPSLRGWQLFGFVQDKWVVSPKLTMDIGLRWELYPPYHPQFAGGFSNYNPTDNTLVIAGVGQNPMNLGAKTRYNYFAPRIGLAYRLSEKTVIRSGFGVSYTPFPDNNYAYNYPIRGNITYDAATTYAAAQISSGQVATFQNGFPTLVLPSVPSSGILPGVANSAYFVVNKDFKNPHVISWNFAIQQSLPKKFTLDLAYVGNHGVDSVVNYDMNAGVVPGANNNGRPLFAQFKRTAATNLLFGAFSTSYNALQVKFDRKAADFNLTTAFTWGKGLGFQTGDDGGLFFYVDQRRNYARNDFDRKFTYVQSLVYRLPFGPGKRWLTSGFTGNLFGNWQATGILTLMSGTPFNVTASSATGLALPGSNQTVDLAGAFNVLGGVGLNSPWFDTSAFKAQNNAGVAGNLGRNLFSGPGFFNLDASLAKIITVRERYKFELRGEFFGVTNTPQFNNPNANISANTFGLVTGAGGGRTAQLGAKVQF